MIIRDPPAGARTEDGRVIPDVVIFPSEYPSPENPKPEMPSLDDLDFIDILFEVTAGIEDASSGEGKKHIWWHEMEYRDNGGKIQKQIYNAADETISLQTHSIDYSRISDVE